MRKFLLIYTIAITMPLAHAQSDFGPSLQSNKTPPASTADTETKETPPEAPDPQSAHDAKQAWDSLFKGKKDAYWKLIDMAQAGNYVAMNYVGVIQDQGLFGIKKNPQNSAKWFGAASASYPLAAYNLGLLNVLGKGIPKNEERAAPLFSYAAERGYIEQAAVRLALYYWKRGEGTKAWNWAQYAANLKNKNGYYLLGRFLYDGTGTPKDAKAAQIWLQKAAERYSADAAAMLATIYSDGNPALSEGWRLIAEGIGRKGLARTLNSTAKLKEEDRQKAQSFATNWLSTHAKPIPIEYDKTLPEMKK